MGQTYKYIKKKKVFMGVRASLCACEHMLWTCFGSQTCMMIQIITRMQDLFIVIFLTLPGRSNDLFCKRNLVKDIIILTTLQLYTSLNEPFLTHSMICFLLAFIFIDHFIVRTKKWSSTTSFPFHWRSQVRKMTLL